MYDETDYLGGGSHNVTVIVVGNGSRIYTFAHFPIFSPVLIKPFCIALLLSLVQLVSKTLFTLQ